MTKGTISLSSSQRRTESKPVRIVSPLHENTNYEKARTPAARHSESSFEEVRVDGSDESFDYPPTPIRNSKKKSNVHEPTMSSSKNYSNQMPKQDTFDGQMLLDSMMDDGSSDQTHPLRPVPRSIKTTSSTDDSNPVFLLLDANERLTVGRR
jgi:hypothetical protein